MNSAPARSGIDIWVEGRYTFYENDVPNASSGGEFGVIYFGARIRPNLYLDVRAARGQSNNNIRARTITTATATFPLGGATVTTGTGTASYDTDRWLVRGNLTGNWQQGDWRFTPSVSATYLEERQEAFTTSIGTFVAPDEFHGRIEGGILVTAVSGRAFRLTTSYDGIGGGGFHSYGAQLWLNVPLN